MLPDYEPCPREQEQQRIGWALYVAMQDRKEQARRDAERAYYQKAWQLEAERARREQELKKKIMEFHQRIGDLLRRKEISQSDALLLYFLPYVLRRACGVVGQEEDTPVQRISDRLWDYMTSRFKNR